MRLRADVTLRMEFVHKQVPHSKLYQNSLEYPHSVTLAGFIPAKFLKLVLWQPLPLSEINTEKFLVAWFVIGKLLCYTPYLSDGFEGCFAWSKGAHTKSISRRKKNTHPKCWIVNELLSDKSLPILKKRENHAVFRWFVCLTAFHMYIKSWSRNQIHYIDCIW